MTDGKETPKTNPYQTPSHTHEQAGEGGCGVGLASTDDDRLGGGADPAADAGDRPETSHRGARMAALVEAWETSGDIQATIAAIATLAELCPTYEAQAQLARMLLDRPKARRAGHGALEQTSGPHPTPADPRDAGGDHTRPARAKASSVVGFYPRAGNGGCERVLVGLAALYARMGLDSGIVTEHPVDEDSYEIDPSVWCGTVPVAEGADSASEGVARRLGAWASLLSAHAVDTVVYHSWLSEWMLFDLMLCRHLGVAFVINTHGAFTYPLLLTHYVKDALPLVSYACALADATVSETDTNACYYSAFTERSWSIPNPVSDELVAASEVPTERPGGVGHEVLWVGSFNRYKRPEDGLAAFALLRRRLPDAHLTIVGGGNDPGEQPHLEGVARGLGIRDQITFTGYRTDVMPFFRSADVLMSTSMAEGFYMILLEASAVGLPTVMYDLPYLPFAASEGVASVPMYDVEALADRLYRVLTDGDDRLRRSAGARAFFDRFVGYDYAGVWRRVLDGERPTREDGYRADMATGRGPLEMVLEHWLMGSLARDEILAQALGDLEAERRAREAAERERDQVSQDLDGVAGSVSFRAGRVLTAPLRLLRDRLGRGR